jgi:hypothetical protein
MPDRPPRRHRTGGAVRSRSTTEPHTERKTFVLIESTLDLILATASTSQDGKRAATAIAPMLATLRRGLETMTFTTPARITTYMPPSVVAGESRAMTAERFAHRLNDLHCARQFGTPEDVRHVIDSTVHEIRVAALGRHGIET